MIFELHSIINSEMFNHASKGRRTNGNRYAWVLIGSCKHKDWWYKDLIGCTVFCQLHFSNFGYGEFLREAQAVRLTGTQIETGRTFDVSDIIII